MRGAIGALKRPGRLLPWARGAQAACSTVSEPMVWDRGLSLRRSRRTGWKICIGAALAAALFLWGLAQGSYWALALPVTAAVLTALGLSFYIGYTILTVRGIPAQAEHYDSRGAKSAALAICVGSVAVGCIFVAGVIAQSYWALAIPVAAAVLGLLGMVFWIGVAIVTQKTTLDRAQSSAAAVPGAAALPPHGAGGIPPRGAGRAPPKGAPNAAPKGRRNPPPKGSGTPAPPDDPADQPDDPAVEQPGISAP